MLAVYVIQPKSPTTTLALDDLDEDDFDEDVDDLLLHGKSKIILSELIETVFADSRGMRPPNARISISRQPVRHRIWRSRRRYG